MHVSTKGQVTIPIRIREKLGLFPDTEVRFRVQGSKVIIEKVKTDQGRGARLVGRMRGAATRRKTTDEIMALTRGE